MLGLAMNSDKSCGKYCYQSNFHHHYHYQLVACSCSGGFSVYNTNPFTRRMIKKGSGTSIIQMLNSTSLLALVPSGDTAGSSPRKLMLWNSQTKETICELPFPSTILAVRMNKNHLITVLDSNIHIFELSSMNNIHTLSAPTNCGLIDLTHNTNENDGGRKSILAFKGMQGGDIVLFDCITLRVLGHIKAHKAPITALTFNSDATLFATASTKGTVVRVFSIPSAQHLMTFRRGSYSCTINSLCFSPCSEYLSAGSSSGTVHIFSLENNKDNEKLPSPEKPKSSVFSISNILPEPAQEFAESTRAIIVTKIPNLDGEFIASLIEGQGEKEMRDSKRSEQSTELLKLIVCTRNGYLYRFSICKSLKNDNDKQPNKGGRYHYIMEDEYNIVADFVDPSIK